VGRPWNSFSESEQVALLADLSSTLHKRIGSLDPGLVQGYRSVAEAARNLSREMGQDASKRPPFSWARMTMDEVGRRLQEVTEWAQARALEQELSVRAREGAQDLRDAGREVQYQLERTRSR
jgi:alkylated DNA nucleotide flippase Atl1